MSGGLLTVSDGGEGEKAEEGHSQRDMLPHSVGTRNGQRSRKAKCKWDCKCKVSAVWLRSLPFINLGAAPSASTEAEAEAISRDRSRDCRAAVLLL